MTNLNKTTIFISNFPYGKTQNEIIKVGRKLYYMNIDKNSASTLIEIYNYKKDRVSMSKYMAWADLSLVTVKNDAIIDRDFIENIKDIEKARKTLVRFSDVVLV